MPGRIKILTAVFTKLLLQERAFRFVHVVAAYHDAVQEPGERIDGMHRRIETIAVFIDTGSDFVASAVMQKRPLDRVQYVLPVPSTAQTFCYGAEVTYEELFEMPQTRFVVVAVPAPLGNLFADFFRIAVEPFNRAEVSTVQLAPFRQECAEDTAGRSHEMLVSGCHYRIVYPSYVSCAYK